MTLKYRAKPHRKCPPVVRKVNFVVQRSAPLSDRPGDLQTEKDWEIPLALQRNLSFIVLSEVVLTSLWKQTRNSY